MMTSYEIYEITELLKKMNKMLNQKETEIDNLRQEVEYYKSRLKRWEDWANPSDNWGCYQ